MCSHTEARTGMRGVSRSAEKVQNEINDRSDDPGLSLFFFLVLGEFFIREGNRILLRIFRIFLFHSVFLSAGYAGPSVGRALHRKYSYFPFSFRGDICPVISIDVLHDRINRPDEIHIRSFHPFPVLLIHDLCLASAVIPYSVCRFSVSCRAFPCVFRRADL